MSTTGYTPVKVLYKEEDKASDSESITIETTEEQMKGQEQLYSHFLQFFKSKWFEIVMIAAIVTIVANVFMTAMFVLQTNTLKAEVAELQEKLQIDQPCSCDQPKPADKSVDHTDSEMQTNLTRHTKS